ncbi:MAG: acylphosphatase [Hyphomicrobiales bacterium]|nr:acylphosphatase [Hyphomicrobiales bacterium]
MGERRTAQLAIRGRVQGVGYRAWLAEQAVQDGLDGWVRNRSDGSVEAVVSGTKVEVEALVARCKVGPRSAVVSDVQTSGSDEIVTNGFNIRPTV